MVARTHVVPDVQAADQAGQVGAGVAGVRRVDQLAEDLAQRLDVRAAEQRGRLGADGAQHPLADGVPLGVVRVQQAVGGPAPDLGGELPAEVGRVLETEVEGLSAHGHYAFRPGPTARAAAPPPIRPLLRRHGRVRQP
ncbi:hypothetical protein GCM10010360_11720 [Streptomyces nogalater]